MTISLTQQRRKGKRERKRGLRREEIPTAGGQRGGRRDNQDSMPVDSGCPTDSVMVLRSHESVWVTCEDEEKMGMSEAKCPRHVKRRRRRKGG